MTILLIELLITTFTTNLLYYISHYILSTLPIGSPPASDQVICTFLKLVLHDRVKFCPSVAVWVSGVSLKSNSSKTQIQNCVRKLAAFLLYCKWLTKISYPLHLYNYLMLDITQLSSWIGASFLQNCSNLSSNKKVLIRFGGQL